MRDVGRCRAAGMLFILSARCAKVQFHYSLCWVNKYIKYYVVYITRSLSDLVSISCFTRVVSKYVMLFTSFAVVVTCIRFGVKYFILFSPFELLAPCDLSRASS